MENKIMYRVYKYSNRIEEAVVVKTTDKSVWINWNDNDGSYHSSVDRIYKELRITKEHAWLETREEAFKWIENQHLRQIQHFENMVRYYNQELNDFYKQNKDITRDLKLNELLGL